ncbi:hypothetical protein ES707_07385 [subsurface metagenome]
MRSSLPTCLRVGRCNSILGVLARVDLSLARVIPPLSGEVFAYLSPLQLKPVSYYVGRNAGRTHADGKIRRLVLRKAPTTGGR